MPQDQRESLRKLQETIRSKRSEIGIHHDKPLPANSLLEALKKNPPIDKLVSFVRQSLQEDTLERLSQPSPPRLRKGFDKKA